MSVYLYFAPTSCHPFEFFDKFNTEIDATEFIMKFGKRGFYFISGSKIFIKKKPYKLFLKEKSCKNNINKGE